MTGYTAGHTVREMTEQSLLPVYIDRAVFVDGGTIGRNPSTLGGTWAYTVIEFGKVVETTSGIVPWPVGKILSNSHAEFFAAFQGVKAIPWWKGERKVYFCSDSQVTLKRLFSGWRHKDIPDEWFDNAARLLTWLRTGGVELIPVQMDGHPTRKQLATGIGKRGNPVCRHQVWCDEACKAEAQEFLKNLPDQPPSTYVPRKRTNKKKVKEEHEPEDPRGSDLRVDEHRVGEPAGAVGGREADRPGPDVREELDAAHEEVQGDPALNQEAPSTGEGA